MLKNIIWIIFIIVIALVQTSWPDSLKLQEVIPDLCLILVVYVAIMEGEVRAMFTALLAGVYQDMASSEVLGHHVLCLVIVAYVTGKLSHRIITEHPAMKIGLVFLAGVVHGLFFMLVRYVQDPINGLIQPILSSTIPTAFFTALLTPFLFFFLSWFTHRMERFKGEAAK